ncbi:hypothetical protein PPTG_12202 [Phytophthora nicotianae INRA-310]|uniref:Tyr recombinase domain-containing protein n=1 Tax=Phytophthora nicotianae (strain INRA-310) TaxID=761204 RepID=W2Q5E5_PHYN3|nr:hypothetical protein PPTG_12202 [Phytophthora nicotianae INRA-310]ETN08403.1 hypothetical protein PPTG_12202 [Phytophthora nicotianae INRA-310]
MLLKGINRLDQPVRHKAPVSLNLLKRQAICLFPLRAGDVILVDYPGSATAHARGATSVHIRLRGSKTNQRGEPTLRMLNRSGHGFLCPGFGALCLFKARHPLPADIPIVVFVSAHSHPDCVSSSAISKVIRQAPVELGDDPADFSPHSLRAGGASHM